MSTPAIRIHFPTELYRFIAENLSHPDDRGALCDLALVSSLLRTESQRVLFRDVFERWHRNDDEDSDEYQQAITRHISFLETILDHPTRLGSLVRVYGHMKLAGRGRLRQKLWRLTLCALPHLVNLRHLHIIQGSHHDPEDEVTLDACSFPHLLSFSWGASTSSAATSHLLAFLERMSTLTHLDVGFQLDTVSPRMFPALESFEMKAYSEWKIRPVVRQLAPRRIKALAMNYSFEFGSDMAKPGLGEMFPHLKYLKVTTLRPEEAGYVGLRVLQLERWNQDNLEFLEGLPHLHTLALLVPSGRRKQIAAKTTGGRAPIRLAPDITDPGNTKELHQLLDTVLQHCPGLKRVVGIPQSAMKDWAVWAWDGETVKTSHVRRIDAYRLNPVWWKVFEEMEEMSQ